MSEGWSAAGISLEYCAFMIAIMVERSQGIEFNSELQISPAEVAEILNSLPGGGSRDLYIESSALHQGVHHFKRFLISRGFTVIEMFSEEDRMIEFHDLGCHLKKGYNVKVPQLKFRTDIRSINQISDDVVIARDNMFKMYKIKKSVYLKATKVYMEIYGKEKKNQIENETNYMTPVVVANKFKTRKNVVTVSEATKKKNTKRLLDMIDETVGEENVTMYIDFINKLNNKRKKLENNNGNINVEIDNDIQLFTNAQMVANDFSVKEIIKTIKKKYNTTTNEEKCQIINLYDAARNACNLILPEEILNDGEIVSITHKLMEETGLCNISKRAILRLMNNKGNILQKRGRKINKNFESEIWANLMICSYDEKADEHNMDEIVRSTVNVNVIYSYAVIVETANTISKQEYWLTTEKVQALKFTPHWVKGMLNRAELRRRKITTDDKKTLSIEEIRRILKIGQDLIISHGHDASTTWNMDETAVTYAIGPTHLYVPWNQARAANIGNVNTKLRITAVLTVNGLGEFAPIFLILKHSDKCISENKPDQTKMRVLDNLHKKSGFRIEENWKLQVWEKEIEVNNTKKIHKCKYLIHTITGHIITSQHKAWNDQVRMVMWFDLVILPIKNTKHKIFLWVDNCGSHKTELVRNFVTNNEIDVAYLPPNMTSELQVLDLVVNGPLKTHIRQLRAKRIVNYLQQYLKDKKENGNTTEFEVPITELVEGICDLFNLFANEFCATKFKDGVNRSFIKTGTIPEYNNSQDISFREYTREEKCGSIPIIPLGTTVNKKKEDNIVLDGSIINDITVNDAINFFDDEDDCDEEDEIIDFNTDE